MRRFLSLALLSLALPVEGRAAPILDSIAHQASCFASQPGATPESFSQTGTATTFNVVGLNCVSGPASGPGESPDAAGAQQISSVAPLFTQSEGLATAGDGLTPGATASSDASITINFTTDADYTYEFLSASGLGIPNVTVFEIRLWEPSSSTDLYLLTENGTAGGTSGFLLAGHTYRLSGFARADTSLFPSGTILSARYEFLFSLAAVPLPEPVAAWLLLPAVLYLARLRIGRAQPRVR